MNLLLPSKEEKKYCYDKLTADYAAFYARNDKNYQKKNLKEKKRERIGEVNERRL
jgi:hypothetical protein